MRVITNLRDINKKFKRPVVSIGIFDGVHLGHKRILKTVSRYAKAIGGKSVVVTFSPHPARLLDMIGSPPLLVSLKHRLNLIGREGIDVVCVLNFTKGFAGQDAQVFVEDMLVKKIGVRCVIIGSDFRFGKGKSGDRRLLKSLGEKYNFSVVGVGLLKIDSQTVTSTRIRSLIMSGRLSEASRFLGRPVSVLGTVVRGSKRGRLLGYPTANINPHHEAIPPSGVYAVYVRVGSRCYKGILNVGTRPTFRKARGPAEPTIEAHIFGFSKDIYGKDIEIIFKKKIRDERRFAGKEDLIKQIRIDEMQTSMVL